jgi:hypothetical protein
MHIKFLSFNYKLIDKQNYSVSLLVIQHDDGKIYKV